MRRFSDLMNLPANGMASRNQTLKPLVDIDHNPGALGARIYVPEGLAPGAPLVVVLHGCTQTADQYDRGAGWSAIAQEYGFALLYPEQQRSNNPNLCFNWFLPQDSRRDRGEALSIRNMITVMVETHQLDPERIYITGLSAGGAMANVMLATYPELFASGAIIAGLPYGTATDVPQALERMRGQGLPGARDLAGLVRGATHHEGPWPTVSIWHGSADATVLPSNAEATARQWLSIHDLPEEPTRIDLVDGYPRRVWCDAHGRDCVESVTITGMSHGTPIAAQGPDACGSPGPYMLDRHISSTRHICRFWGLADKLAPSAEKVRQPVIPLKKAEPAQPMDMPNVLPPYAPVNRTMILSADPTAKISKVIEEAFRAAGLMH